MKWQDGLTYAQDVVKGEINVCNDVRLACQRFINQFENKEWQYEFKPEYADHVLRFFSVLKHTKGPQAGQAVTLEPFQILLVCAIYGFRSKKDQSKRMVTDVILFIPRKAGKSTLTSGLALYELQFGKLVPRCFVWQPIENRQQLFLIPPKGLLNQCHSN